MKGLREKFRNKKGFTLVEMLIVVAIIAILIAVSIPLVNGALEKARKATDDANARAAAAVANIIYLTEGKKDNVDGKFYAVSTTGGSQGSLVAGNSSNPKPYKGQSSEHKGDYIKVSCDDDGKIAITWAENTTT